MYVLHSILVHAIIATPGRILDLLNYPELLMHYPYYHLRNNEADSYCNELFEHLLT
jgi:superfamily II DNA/RNA helicase